MNTKHISRLAGISGLVALSYGLMMGGSWQHTQSSPGSFSQNVTVPAATVQQIAEGALAGNTSINYGPLANLQVNGVGYQSKNGPVAAGTYSVYQSETLTNGGFSTTVFSW